MRRLFVCSLLLLLAAGALGAGKPSRTPAELLKSLRDVDTEAKGHKAATDAWAELTAQAKADQIVDILTAIDGASPLAANWLRAAVDAIAERQLQKDGTLPVAALQGFLDHKDHDPRARRLAYEWIARADPGAPDRLMANMLDDPSLEMRRDAVARVLMAADKATTEQNKDLALITYQKALSHARDVDQVLAAAEALKKLGHPVDLARQFGFLQDWKVVGPFDNRQGVGFAIAYPPETGVNFAAKYATPDGMIGWLPLHTNDEFGSTDLNAALGKHMGAVAYVAAEFQSDHAGPVELRLGTESANKIWLNGKLLAAAEVYHANGPTDQYVGRGELRAGRNLILLKICQNEQKEDWAQDWKFQLRACDASGKAILSTDRPASAPDPAANQVSKE